MSHYAICFIAEFAQNVLKPAGLIEGSADLFGESYQWLLVEMDSQYQYCTPCIKQCDSIMTLWTNGIRFDVLCCSILKNQCRVGSSVINR